jgi:phosphate starvation-inducible PhoH-like protein
VLERVEGISFVRFGGEDVVRHKLVQRIVAAYDAHDDNGRAARQEHGPTPRS